MANNKKNAKVEAAANVQAGKKSELVLIKEKFLQFVAAQAPKDDGNKFINAVTAVVPPCAYKISEDGTMTVNAFDGTKEVTIISFKNENGKYKGTMTVSGQVFPLAQWAGERLENYCLKGGNVRGGSSKGKSSIMDAISNLEAAPAAKLTPVSAPELPPPPVAEPEIESDIPDAETAVA